jgi:hypothetical protein
MRRFITGSALLLSVGIGVFGGAAYRQAAVVHADDGGVGAGTCRVGGKRQPTGDGTLTCDCTVTTNQDCHCDVPAPPRGCNLLE